MDIRQQTYWRTTELVGGITAAELARLVGRSEDASRSAARRHGIALAPKPRGYSEATRRRVMAMRARGTSFPEIARATGVSQRTAQSWVYSSRESS